MCRARLEFGRIVRMIKKPLSILSIAVTVSTASASGDGILSPLVTPQLVVMDPIVVPIVGSDRLDGSLHLKLVLAAADASALARLTERLPVLRAASIASAIEFGRLYASPRTPVNAEILRAELTAALRAADHDVRDLLIVEVAAVA